MTATALRPSGTIVFGDERIDVVSEGAFIDKDEQVKFESGRLTHCREESIDILIL